MGCFDWHFNQIPDGLQGQVRGRNFIGAALQLLDDQLLIWYFVLIFQLVFDAGPAVHGNAPGTAEWAGMPSDSKGISSEEIIHNLSDYNIAFFPVAPGYYSTHKISGVHYDVRSSFIDEGKSLESLLENVIIERATKANQRPII